MKRIALIALLTLPIAFSGSAQGKKDKGAKGRSAEPAIAFVKHIVETTSDASIHSITMLNSSGDTKTMDLGKIPLGKGNIDEKVSSNERYFTFFTELINDGFELEGQSATTATTKGGSTSVTTFTFIRD